MKKERTQVQIRTARELRYFLNQIMARASFGDPVLEHAQDISFSHVELSPDLQNARINCSFLRKDSQEMPTEDMIKALNKAQGFFKKELSKISNLRYIPRMKFAEDAIYDRNDKFEQMMRKLDTKS